MSLSTIKQIIMDTNMFIHTMTVIHFMNGEGVCLDYQNYFYCLHLFKPQLMM